MAYRFISTNKYDDPWFLDLSPDAKLLFDYLICKVNNAGFLEESIKRICFDIGWEKETYLGAKEGLKRGLIHSDDKTIIYLKNFLKHQKNLPLNKHNNAHKNIFELFREGIKKFSDNQDFFFEIPCHHILRSKENILENKEENLGAYLGLISPTGKGNNIGKGNSIDNSNKEVSINLSKLRESGLMFTEGNTDDLISEIKNSESWKNNLAILYKVSIETVNEKLDFFLSREKLNNKLVGRMMRDIKEYFGNYLNKNKTNDTGSEGKSKLQQVTEV